MPTPRLTVGLFGGDDLAEPLERAGHIVREINGDGDHLEVDLIVLELEGRVLETVVHEWVTEVRRGQMVLHTAVEFGPQVLDPLEIQGAIVMAAHRVWKNFWVGSAADEVGESVLSLLIPEMGGNLTIVEDHQRPAIMAGKQMLSLVDEARLDAFDLLCKAVPALTLENDDYWLLPDQGHPTADNVNFLEEMYGVIEDPSIASLFVELVRRRAVRRGGADKLRWAEQKRSR